MPVDYFLELEGVVGESKLVEPRALAALAQELRSAGIPVTVSVVGSGGPAWHRVLDKLWRAGAAPAALLLPTAGLQGTWIVMAPLAPLQARASVQQRLQRTGDAATLPTLALSGGTTTEPIALLLPAVQSAREAARRI